ncbi:MAG: hypothetical protein WBJ37_11805 [Bacteroidales bacterium]
MKLFIKYFLFIPLIFSGYLYAQNSRYLKELSLLTIKSQQFDSIISNSICCLKNCNYYSKAIVFRVTIAEIRDSTYIDIAAVHDKKIALTNRYGNPFGYYFFCEHLFIVFCDTLPDIFEQEQFKKQFWINDKPDILLIADYPEWLYLFQDNKFFLKKAINECNKK